MRTGLRVGTAASTAGAPSRSHLPDGRVVGWYGGGGGVVDAEPAAAPVPAFLARRYGRDDFWGRWTRTECAAKLADVPIVVWLRTRGLEPGDLVDVVTLDVEDLVVSVGWSRG